MFDSLETSLEFSYKLIWLIAIIYIVFSGGFGFLMKLISTPFNIKFSSNKLRKLDEDFFDLQLLRFFHGIHVATKEDALLVSKAIKKKLLTKKDFRFLSLCPPIGDYKRNKLELAMLSFVIVIAVMLLTLLFSALNESKYNYAFYSQDDTKVLISTTKIFNPKSKAYTSKLDCKNSEKELPKITQSACKYLITDNKDEQEELLTAINDNNKSFIIILALFFLIGTLTFFSFIANIQFQRTNNIFFTFKTEESQSNQESE